MILNLNAVKIKSKFSFRWNILKTYKIRNANKLIVQILLNTIQALQISREFCLFVFFKHKLKSLIFFIIKSRVLNGQIWVCLCDKIRHYWGIKVDKIDNVVYKRAWVRRIKRYLICSELIPSDSTWADLCQVLINGSDNHLCWCCL